MKTPEEIKKGLALCVNANSFNYPCDECPYEKEEDGCKSMMEDALALIQQLEWDKNWASENYDLISEENKRLEAQNAELVRKTDKLQSSMGQEAKALQNNGFQTLEELLQAFSQKEE